MKVLEGWSRACEEQGEGVVAGSPRKKLRLHSRLLAAQPELWGQNVQRN